MTNNVYIICRNTSQPRTLLSKFSHEEREMRDTAKSAIITLIIMYLGYDHPSDSLLSQDSWTFVRSYIYSSYFFNISHFALSIWRKNCRTRISVVFINNRGQSVVKVLLSAAQFHVRILDGEVNTSWIRRNYGVTHARIHISELITIHPIKVEPFSQLEGIDKWTFF